MPPSEAVPGPLRRRLDRLAPGRRRAVALPLVAGLLAAAYLLTVWAQALVGDDPVNWLQPLPGLLGSFAGGYIGVRLQRRRLGGWDRMRAYERAARTGRLPDDADPVVWRPLLERELRVRQRVMRGTTSGVVLLFAVAWVAVAVLYEIRWVWWLVASASIALFAAWLRWLGRRQTRRIRRLLDQLPDAVPPAG